LSIRRYSPFPICGPEKGVITLLQHPEQLNALKKDPSLAVGAVEELCRYHTASALATRRVATQEVLLGGKVVSITLWIPLTKQHFS